MEALTLATIVFVIYFFPWVVAMLRKHPQVNAITLLNFFLGWTFVGWVVALVWASMAFDRPSSTDS